MKKLNYVLHILVYYRYHERIRKELLHTYADFAAFQSHRYYYGITMKWGGQDAESHRSRREPSKEYNGVRIRLIIWW